MLGFGVKKCFLCKSKVENGGLREDVEIYGRVGTWKRDFCSEKHLNFYLERTEALMKTRRPCLPCALR